MESKTHHDEDSSAVCIYKYMRIYVLMYAGRPQQLRDAKCEHKSNDRVVAQNGMYVFVFIYIYNHACKYMLMISKRHMCIIYRYGVATVSRID